MKTNEYYKDQRGKIWHWSGEIIRWKICGDIEERDYYKMLCPADVFKGYDYMNDDDIAKMEIIPNPYLSENELERRLSEIETKLIPLRQQEDELKKQIREIESEKRSIQALCKHEWEKGEEEMGKRDILGTSYTQLCECTKCGLTKTNPFTRIE